MKAIQYLKRIATMDAQIDVDILEIARLEALATKTTSVMGGERVQSSGSQDKMADCVVKIADMRKELNEEIDRFLEYKQEARALIADACDSDCCSLLHRRYFLNNTWEQIAVELGYTYQWVAGGLHQRALSQLQRVLDERQEENDGEQEVRNMRIGFRCEKMS